MIMIIIQDKKLDPLCKIMFWVLFHFQFKKYHVNFKGFVINNLKLIRFIWTFFVFREIKL